MLAQLASLVVQNDARGIPIGDREVRGALVEPFAEEELVQDDEERQVLQGGVAEERRQPYQRPRRRARRAELLQTGQIVVRRVMLLRVEGEVYDGFASVVGREKAPSARTSRRSQPFA